MIDIRVHLDPLSRVSVMTKGL